MLAPCFDHQCWPFCHLLIFVGLGMTGQKPQKQGIFRCDLFFAPRTFPTSVSSSKKNASFMRQKRLPLVRISATTDARIAEIRAYSKFGRLTAFSKLMAGGHCVLGVPSAVLKRRTPSGADILPWFHFWGKGSSSLRMENSSSSPIRPSYNIA
jgi:hypothetical protein